MATPVVQPHFFDSVVNYHQHQVPFFALADPVRPFFDLAVVGKLARPFCVSADDRNNIRPAVSFVSVAKVNFYDSDDGIDF